MAQIVGLNDQGKEFLKHVWPDIVHALSHEDFSALRKEILRIDPWGSATLEELEDTEGRSLTTGYQRLDFQLQTAKRLERLSDAQSELLIDGFSECLPSMDWLRKVLIKIEKSELATETIGYPPCGVTARSPQQQIIETVKEYTRVNMDHLDGLPLDQVMEALDLEETYCPLRVLDDAIYATLFLDGEPNTADLAFLKELNDLTAKKKEEGFVVLLRGTTGSGKTGLIRKCLHEWAIGSKLLFDIQLCIANSLSIYQCSDSEHSLVDFVFRPYEDFCKRVSGSADISEALSGLSNQTLVILDGWEDLSPSLRNEVSKKIQEDLIAHGYNVLVTGSEMKELSEDVAPDRSYLINGVQYKGFQMSMGKWAEIIKKFHQGELNSDSDTSSLGSTSSTGTSDETQASTVTTKIIEQYKTMAHLLNQKLKPLVLHMLGILFTVNRGREILEKQLSTVQQQDKPIYTKDIITALINLILETRNDQVFISSSREMLHYQDLNQKIPLLLQKISEQHKSDGYIRLSDTDLQGDKDKMIWELQQTGLLDGYWLNKLHPHDHPDNMYGFPSRVFSDHLVHAILCEGKEQIAGPECGSYCQNILNGPMWRQPLFTVDDECVLGCVGLYNFSKQEARELGKALLQYLPSSFDLAALDVSSIKEHLGNINNRIENIFINKDGCYDLIYYSGATCKHQGFIRFQIRGYIIQISTCSQIPIGLHIEEEFQKFCEKPDLHTLPPDHVVAQVSAYLTSKFPLHTWCVISSEKDQMKFKIDSAMVYESKDRVIVAFSQSVWLRKLIYLVTGMDNSDPSNPRPAWHYVLVDPTKLDEFLDRTSGKYEGNVDIKDFSIILKSGWGTEKDIPEMAKITADNWRQVVKGNCNEKFPILNKILESEGLDKIEPSSSSQQQASGADGQGPDAVLRYIMQARANVQQMDSDSGFGTRTRSDSVSVSGKAMSGITHTTYQLSLQDEDEDTLGMEPETGE